MLQYFEVPRIQYALAGNARHRPAPIRACSRAGAAAPSERPDKTKPARKLKTAPHPGTVSASRRRTGRTEKENPGAMRM
jgi:hypothetical protein